VRRPAVLIGVGTMSQRQLTQPRFDINTEQCFYPRTRGHEW
jgi:hypothetical protein